MNTISLKGNKYAKVVDRLRQFKGDHPDHIIVTQYEVINDRVIFSARVHFHRSCYGFIGHAAGSFTGQKTFEKTETIAVGRALAFAGYYADGEIASYEEVEDLYNTKQYQDARYRLESIIEDAERIIGDSEHLEEIRNAMDTMNPERMYQAVRYVRENFIEESKKANRDYSKTEVNKIVKEAIKEEVLQSKMNDEV